MALPRASTARHPCRNPTTDPHRYTFGDALHRPRWCIHGCVTHPTELPATPAGHGIDIAAQQELATVPRPPCVNHGFAGGRLAHAVPWRHWLVLIRHENRWGGSSPNTQTVPAARTSHPAPPVRVRSPVPHESPPTLPSSRVAASQRKSLLADDVADDACFPEDAVPTSKHTCVVQSARLSMMLAPALARAP